jgi:hypothetical protein
MLQHQRGEAALRLLDDPRYVRNPGGADRGSSQAILEAAAVGVQAMSPGSAPAPPPAARPGAAGGEAQQLVGRLLERSRGDAAQAAKRLERFLRRPGLAERDRHTARQALQLLQRGPVTEAPAAWSLQGILEQVRAAERQAAAGQRRNAALSLAQAQGMIAEAMAGLL